MNNNRRGKPAKSSRSSQAVRGKDREKITPGSAALQEENLKDSLITDGKLNGKRIVNSDLDGSVPMPATDRLSVFELIGESIRFARFLDLCAGTGAIGIEAISRGAQVCTFVERKMKRCELIRENLEAVGIKEGHGEIFEEEAVPFLKKMSSKRRFWDVVFWDPPLDTDYDDGFRFLAEGSVIRPEGTLLLRHHSEMFFDGKIGRLQRKEVLEAGSGAVTLFERKY